MESNSQKQREIFAKNLQYWCKQKNITQSDIVETFSLPASTVSDWFNGKKFPRIDKIQMLADYLGIQKSDLIEEKSNLDDIYMHLAKEAEKLKLDKQDIDYIIDFYRKNKR